jgi:hypothetical protein
MDRGGDRLKVRSVVLAALVVVAANSAHACDENCSVRLTDPMTGKSTEGTDPFCELRKQACQLCAEEKAESTGVTLACATCVMARPFGGIAARCIALCGGAAKAQEVYYAAGCI